MEVSILPGSIRQARQSHRLAYYLKDQITKKGVTVYRRKIHEKI